MAALVATIALSIGTSAATANRSIETAAARTSGAARSVTFSSETDIVICDVSITGQLHRAIGKVRGALAGFISAANAANCRDNLGVNRDGIAFQLETPWHIQFNSFTGTLPNITNILFLITIGYIGTIGTTECLHRGILGLDAAVAGGEVRTLRIQVPNTIPMIRVIREEVLRRCPREDSLAGSFALNPAVRVRLI